MRGMKQAGRGERCETGRQGPEVLIAKKVTLPLLETTWVSENMEVAQKFRGQVE